MKDSESAKMTRRKMMLGGAGAALGGVLGTAGSAKPADPPTNQSVYEAIGVRHVINATGTVTIL
jgi:hypothetical protein